MWQMVMLLVLLSQWPLIAAWGLTTGWPLGHRKPILPVLCSVSGQLKMIKNRKKSMEEPKLSDSVFLHGDVRSSVLKTQKKIQKLGKLKRPLLNFFKY